MKSGLISLNQQFMGKITSSGNQFVQREKPIDRPTTSPACFVVGLFSHVCLFSSPGSVVVTRNLTTSFHFWAVGPWSPDLTSGPTSLQVCWPGLATSIQVFFSVMKSNWTTSAFYSLCFWPDEFYPYHLKLLFTWTTSCSHNKPCHMWFMFHLHFGKWSSMTSRRTKMQ